MDLTITAITNHHIPYLNTMTIRTSDGRIIVLDRQRTEYTYDEANDRMTMYWVNLYIWDGEVENYNIPDGIFDDAVVTEIEIEDDAPEGYIFNPITVALMGKEMLIEKS